VNEETSRRKNEEIKKRLSFFLSFFLTLRQFFWVCSLIVNAGYSQNSFLLKSGGWGTNNENINIDNRK
jgi:hypothetical protein